MNDVTKKGLGRGLDALLGDDGLDFLDSEIGQNIDENKVSVDSLYPSPLQPRKDFDEDALNALAESVKNKGVLQPLLVRKNGEKYEIIAGERRYRAAKIAGIAEVPVIIKNINDEEVLEIALIENLMRENLSPIEEAEGFSKLINDFSHTQDALSQVIGKSRSHIANTLRLLNLPQSVQDLVRQGKLTAGHARALVGLDNAEILAEKVIKEGLNVRQTENLVAKQKSNVPSGTIARFKSPDLVNIEKDLFDNFSLKVKISASKNNKGSVSIKYDSIAELEKIIDLLEKRS